MAMHFIQNLLVCMENQSVWKTVTPKPEGTTIITSMCHFFDLQFFQKLLNGCWKFNGGDNQLWLGILSRTDLWALPLGQEYLIHSGSHFYARAASLMRKIKADQQQMLLVKSLKTTALFIPSSFKEMYIWLGCQQPWDAETGFVEHLRLIFSGSQARQNWSHTGSKDEEHKRKTNFNAILMAQTS